MKQVRRWRCALAALGVVVGGHREDGDQVGHAALADEPLRAVDDPVGVVAGAVASGPRARRRDVRARLGLGQGERDERPARPRDPGTSAASARRVPARRSGRLAELLDREDQAARRADAADLLDREADRQQVATEPAVLARGTAGEDVVAREQLLDVPRELGGPVDLGGTRRDPLVGEDADGVAERELVVGQAVGRGRARRAPGGWAAGDELAIRPSVAAVASGRDQRARCGPRSSATLRQAASGARGPRSSRARTRHGPDDRSSSSWSSPPASGWSRCC